LYTDNITYFVFREHEKRREGETDEKCEEQKSEKNRPSLFVRIR